MICGNIRRGPSYFGIRLTHREENRAKTASSTLGAVNRAGGCCREPNPVLATKIPAIGTFLMS